MNSTASHLDGFNSVFHLEQSSFGRIGAYTVIVFRSRKLSAIRGEQRNEHPLTERDTL